MSKVEKPNRKNQKERRAAKKQQLQSRLHLENAAEAAVTIEQQHHMPTDNTPCLSEQDFKGEEKDLYASHTQPATYRDNEEGPDTKGNGYEENQPLLQSSPFDMDRKLNGEQAPTQDSPQPSSPHIIPKMHNKDLTIAGQNGKAIFDQSFVKPPPPAKKPGIPRCRSNQNLAPGSGRANLVGQKHHAYQNQQSVNNLLNFESKLEKDLQDTTASLMNRMKGHSLLSNESIPLMQPIEDRLQYSFDRMKKEFIPANKNYFAMSLKVFFQSLSEDELEFLCHNYVHNWINEELQRSNRLLAKYQVEQKLDYIRNRGYSSAAALTSRSPRMNKTGSGSRIVKKGDPYQAKLDALEGDGSIYGSVSMEQTLPRFMNPTIGKIRKHEEQFQAEVVRPNELVRRDSPAKAASLRGSRIGSSQYGNDKQAWKPTGVRDLSLEQSNRERMERGSPSKSYDLGSMSVTQSRMQRARSTAAFQPYEESNSQVTTRQEQHTLVDRLHSDAKFKKEMRAIYDQVKVEKELKDCTFAPNKGSSKKKNIPRHSLTREQSHRTLGKSKQLAVSLVRRGQGNETEISNVKEVRDNDSSKAGPKNRGRNSGVSKQKTADSNADENMILEDVFEADKSLGPSDEPAGLQRQNTISKESVHSKSGKKQNAGELFEYLAYNGVKNQKAQELEKLKNRKDLEKCTFRPQIIKYQRTYENNKNVYENLMHQQKDYKLYEQARKEIELKDCSFQPTIDKKSEKIAKETRTGPAEKSYEVLHKKHQQQLEKAKKLVRDKENKEMSECTFAPALITKQKAVPRPSLQQQTTVPIEEQRIQVPGQSLSNKMKLNKYKTESNADSDSVKQNTPQKASALLNHQSSVGNLQKRKGKQSRHGNNVQSMNISATVRSASSSMVAKDQGAAGPPGMSQNSYQASVPSRSSAEQSLNYKTNVCPPPAGARRPVKYQAHRSPPQAEANDGGFRGNYQRVNS